MIKFENPITAEEMLKEITKYCRSINNHYQQGDECKKYCKIYNYCNKCNGYFVEYVKSNNIKELKEAYKKINENEKEILCTESIQKLIINGYQHTELLQNAIKKFIAATGGEFEEMDLETLILLCHEYYMINDELTGEIV